MSQTVKHLSTMWETQVRSLGQEDPLEKEIAIHSSTIAWKIPWTEEPGRLRVHGVAKSRTRMSNFTYFTYFLKDFDCCRICTAFASVASTVLLTKAPQGTVEWAKV